LVNCCGSVGAALEQVFGEVKPWLFSVDAITIRALLSRGERSAQQQQRRQNAVLISFNAKKRKFGGGGGI